MIIQRLKIRNFGCLGEREFEFANGLNIIRGPNEAGKSTLQAALLTVLFQKADTTSQAVHRWQSWGAKNLFEIMLEFTAAGHRWRLEKNFASKEVCLADLDSGEERTDHSKVQDEIAQLLGTGSQDIYESTAAIRQQQISALEAGGEL
ncbi:MAG: AAA family ATPase, partial [Armatimonadetes bacterium]|nr:AAA family ATPase [Armatimonadota bacterium]